MSALPATMMCVEIKQPGGPEALVPATRPLPQPKNGELLIKVAAVGVNRPDPRTPAALGRRLAITADPVAGNERQLAIVGRPRRHPRIAR